MGQKKPRDRPGTGVFAADEQTGKVFELEDETPLDIGAATVSVVYLITMLGVFAWQFVDIYTGKMVLLNWIVTDPEKTACLHAGTCLVMVYAIIGGGLGGTINGFRSILVWHAERRAFGWRHLWKYISLPLLGATLAAFVYALTRAGIGVIGGMDVSKANADSPMTLFSAFGIGALAGYASHEVLKWLDSQANKMFKVSETPTVELSNLQGKTEQEAKDVLRTLALNVGSISKEPSSDPKKVGKVVSQSQPAATQVSKGSSIDITIAETPTPEIPDLTGKTEQEVKDTLRTLKLNTGNISKQPSHDPNQVGKVVSQSPAKGTKVSGGSSVDITIAE